MLYVFVASAEDDMYELCVSHKETDQDDPFVIMSSNDVIEVNAKGQQFVNELELAKVKYEWNAW